MLIQSEKIDEIINKIKKDLLTDYKKKHYNEIYITEYNLLYRIEKELKYLTN